MTAKPRALTRLTIIFKDYNLRSLFPSADKVIIIPTTQITDVLVTFNNDLVKASNIFVILKPLRL